MGNILTDRATASGARGGGTAQVRRLWSLPYAVHVAALATILLAVLVVIRPHIAYSSDEGAAILQARLLRSTGHWLINDPVARLDPKALARPIPRADVGVKGRAPYGKHPFYPLVLLAASWLVGPVGYLLVSVLGTVAAAAAAGVLARRLDPLLDRPVLWAVGVVSPLWFDSFWVIAHSLAAGTGAVGVLFLVWGVEAAGVRRFASFVGAAVAVAATAALRSEGLVLAIAIAIGAGAWAVVAKAITPLGAAVAALAGGAATRLVERHTSTAILGAGSQPVGVPGAGMSFVSARIDAFRSTIIHPAYGTDRQALILVAGALALLLGAVVARRTGSARVITDAAIAATLLYAAWAVVGLRTPIPGLLVACPAAGAAAICFDIEALRRPIGALLTVTVVVGAGAVLATEYYYGGGVEWGGRFFAIFWPLAVPPLAFGVLRLPGPQRRALLTGIVGTGLALAVTGVVSFHQVHRSSQETSDAVERCAREAGPPGSPLLDSRPLAVSTDRLLPQIDWGTFDRYEWLNPDVGDLGPYMARVRSAGVQRLVLATLIPKQELPQPGYRQVASCPAGPGFTVVVLQAVP